MEKLSKFAKIACQWAVLISCIPVIFLGFVYVVTVAGFADGKALGNRYIDGL